MSLCCGDRAELLSPFLKSRADDVKWRLLDSRLHLLVTHTVCTYIHVGDNVHMSVSYFPAHDIQPIIALHVHKCLAHALSPGPDLAFRLRQRLP